MTNPLVLVADGDPKNLQILKENLEASGFLVINVANGNKAWEEIQRNPPKLILTELNLEGLTGYQLLERLQADPNTASIPLIFLTNQREIQQRVRAFEMGAKDYLIKPLHVKEVIAHIRMVIRRLERRKVEQSETYMKFSGRLDQLNLADLIESFGVERKTGILTLSNGRRTGHIYFRDGAVVNASLGDFKQETAAYQMFPWNRGYFNMVFRDIDVPDEISTSNLGLLLQGIKRIDVREKLINQLSSPKTSFTVTPTFKMLLEKKKVGGDALNFIDLLDGKRDIEQIIDDGGLDDLITLKRIVRLYQQGFIKPTIPPAKKPVLPEKIEHKKEMRELTGRPKPIEEEIIEESIFADEEISEDNFFEVTPHQKREELEKEIKPIFERIEKVNQQLLVPEEEKPEEPIRETEPEPEQVTEEIFPEEKESAPVTSSEDQELDVYSDTIFVDEELLRERFGVEEESESKTPVIQREPEPISRKSDEPKEPVKLEPPKIAEKKTKVPSMIDKTGIVDRYKSDLKKPASVEPTYTRNTILVVSVDDDCKDELMDILTNNNFESKKIGELDDLLINFGKIKFDGYSQFNLVAISVDKQFAPFVTSLRQRITGTIFSFDCSQPETWEYTSYLIHSIWSKFQIPYIVAVMNFHEQNSITMDVIRYHLKLSEDIPMMEWDPVDKSSIRELLSLVTKTNLKEKPRKTSEMLDSLVEKVMM